MNKKPIVLWPGDKRLLDGSEDIIYLGSAISMGVLGLILGLMSFFIYWNNFPGLPLPQSSASKFFHFKGGLLVLLSHISPIFQTSSYDGYLKFIASINQPGSSDLTSLALRWVLTFITTAAMSVWFFMLAYKPVSSIKQVRGKKKLEGKAAYDDLKMQWMGTKGSGLLVGRFEDYDPSKAENYTKENLSTIIQLPENFRRTHSIYIGGTGRGKTNTIMTMVVAPIYQYIRFGWFWKGLKRAKGIFSKLMTSSEEVQNDAEMYKLFIIDTPKGDYVNYFYAKHRILVSPETKGASCWDIANDLNHRLKAQAYWEGVIPSNDKDPIWPTSARMAATATTASLINLAPGCWNYGMQAYQLMRPAEQLKKLVEEHYPEGNQILNAAEQTLSSVMFNIGAYTSSFVELARIYDGFDIKKSICQATAKALKFPAYLDAVSQDLFLYGNDPTMPEMVRGCMGLMFKGVTRYMNKEQPDWNWKDYAEFLKKNPLPTHLMKATPFLSGEELKVLSTDFLGGWQKLCSQIVTYAEKWDKIEAAKKFSLREWLTNENPEKRILVLKPSETFPTLTEGLIRGMLFYANSVILGELKNSNTRRLQILIDELQSNGNIDPFLGPALELYRSKGCGLALAFQDLSQLEKLYGEDFVRFLTANVANIFLMGVNQGTTAEKLSEMVGKMDILKMHTSQSEGGSSRNWQEHSAPVITADEINTKLGFKNGYISFLYLANGLNPAYILKNRQINYKERYTPALADWVTATPSSTSTELVSMEPFWRKASADLKAASDEARRQVEIEVEDEPRPDSPEELEAELQDGQDWLDAQHDELSPPTRPPAKAPSSSSGGNPFLESMNRKIEEIDSI